MSTFDLQLRWHLLRAYLISATQRLAIRVIAVDRR